MTKCKICKSEPCWSAFGKGGYQCKKSSYYGMAHNHNMNLKMCNNKFIGDEKEWNNHNALD
jgi:hypothetical protein